MTTDERMEVPHRRSHSSAAGTTRRARPGRRLVNILLATVAATGVVTTTATPGADPVVSALTLVVDSETPVLDADLPSADQDGATSLADAVFRANESPGFDTITFAPGVATIDTVEVPTISNDLAVRGPGRFELVLTNSDGDGLSVGSGASLSVADLSIVGPRRAGAPADGVAADGAGALVVSDVSLDDVRRGVDVVAGAGSALTLDNVGSIAATEQAVSAEGAGAVSVLDAVFDDVGGGLRVVGASSLAVTQLTTLGATGPALDVRGVPSVTLSRLSSTRDAVPSAGSAAGVVGVVDSSSVVLDDVELTRAGSQRGGSLVLDDVGTVDARRVRVGDGAGGLVLRRVGSASVERPVVSRNASDALSVLDASGAVTVDDALLSDNANVGIVADASGVVRGGELSVTASTVLRNLGGAMSVTETGDVRVESTMFSRNGTTAPSSVGGVLLGRDTSASSTVLDRVALVGNRGGAVGGVGVLERTGTVEIVDSDLVSNTGTVAGALGVRSSPAVTVTLSSSVVTGQTGSTPVVAADAGSLLVRGSSALGNVASTVVSVTGASSVELSQSTVTDNDVSQAVVEVGGTASAAVVQSTVSDNRSTGVVRRRGSGAGALRVANSIVTANGGPLAAAGHQGPRPVADASLVPVGTPAGGRGNIATDDPRLGPAEDTLGTTPTLLPAAGSPAVDRGDVALVPAGTTRDQRGQPRQAGGRVDIGSVERQRTPFVVGLAPARLLDTRRLATAVTVDGRFQGIGPRGNGEELFLQVTGRAGVPADAEAVVVNLTAIRPTQAGFVTVHPCLFNPTLTSSLNFRVSADSGNEIVVDLDDEGRICLFTQGVTDLALDLVGYVPATSLYRTIRPSRILDTRLTGITVDRRFQNTGRLEAGSRFELEVGGRAGISSDAVAVVVNVTAVKPGRKGFITVHPCLDTVPRAASLNYQVGVVRGNEIIAQLSPRGTICVFTSESTELVVDVVGEVTSENTYRPVAPARIVETRTGSGTVDGRQNAIGVRPANGVLRVEVGGRAGVPTTARGVVVNATVVVPENRGYLTVWNCEGAPPVAASLNHVLGEVVGNELVIDLAGGAFCVFNSVGTDLTLDVVGYLE